MQTCKPIDTPVEKGSTLSLSMCPQTVKKKKMARVAYSNVIGSLMCAMMCAQPDMYHAVDLFIRFQANPGFAHWQVVKWIFRYLKRTTDYMLCYQASNLCLFGYSDADWGGNPNECKSTSGYALLLNGEAITWCSKKQICVALSIMELEYVVGSMIVQEGVWLRRFL